MLFGHTCLGWCCFEFFLFFLNGRDLQDVSELFSQTDLAAFFRATLWNGIKLLKTLCCLGKDLTVLISFQDSE